jgi:hypothetical protein
VFALRGDSCREWLRDVQVEFARPLSIGGGNGSSCPIADLPSGGGQLGRVRPAFEYYASSDQLQLRQTVKLKRDFTFLLHVDQHPDFIVARPAGRASHGVTATPYAPIHLSYSFDNSKKWVIDGPSTS